jgi:hypothetical protein
MLRDFRDNAAPPYEGKCNYWHGGCSWKMTPAPARGNSRAGLRGMTRNAGQTTRKKHHEINGRTISDARGARLHTESP